MRRWLFTVGMAAVCVSGCATVGPNYKTPASAVINDQAANGPFVSVAGETSPNAPPDAWWRLFGDPVLDGLVDQAMAHNTDLRIAEAALERTDGLLSEARAARQPDVRSDAETSWVQQSAEAALQHTQPPERQTYNLGLTVGYDLDLFGGIRRGIEAAKADDEAAVAARDLVRINVAASTVKAYADLCNAGRQADVLTQLVAVQTRSLSLTRELIARGRTPAFEQERQQGAIEEAGAHLPLLRARQRNAAYRLATLVGRPPEAFERSLLSCDKPLTLQTPFPTGDGAGLLRRRPDVRAAERRLAAATARIGVATAALYPDIRFGGSVGSTGAGVDFLSPLTNRFGVGPQITWDLQQSQARARVEEANAASRMALASFDGVVLSALRETESALNDYGAAQTRLDQLQSALAHARETDARTAELRRGGRVGGLVALDAERADVLASQAVAAAQADVNAAQVATFLALGGGWRSSGIRPVAAASGPGKAGPAGRAGQVKRRQPDGAERTRRDAV